MEVLRGILPVIPYDIHFAISFVMSLCEFMKGFYRCFAKIVSANLLKNTASWEKRWKIY